MQIDPKKLIGEATEYDKKRSVERKKVKDWLKSVSAFANSFGGTLIWGITNDNEVVGLDDAKYMDRRGSGFKKILDSYEFQEHYTEEMKPEFKSSNSEFWLIFKNLNYRAKEIEDALAVETTGKERHYLNLDGQDMDRLIVDFCIEPKSLIEIMDYCGFKSRTSFRRVYLQKMLDEGILKMTKPNKPSSRNQKYYS